MKKPSTLSFLPLREALSKPEPFMETDFAKIGRPDVLHQAFRGLDKVKRERLVQGVITCRGKRNKCRRVVLVSSEESPLVRRSCIFAEFD